MVRQQRIEVVKKLYPLLYFACHRRHARADDLTERDLRILHHVGVGGESYAAGGRRARADRPRNREEEPMKRIVTVGGSLVAVLAIAFGVVWVVGRSLPVAHRVTLARSIAAPSGQVWGRIADVERWSSWRVDLSRVELRPPDHVLVTDRQGTVRYRLLRPAPRTLVTVIDHRGLPYGGSWTWSVQPDGEGVTRVSITEDGEVYDPIFRFFARFVFGHDATLRSVLDQLEASFDPSRREPEPRVPRP